MDFGYNNVTFPRPQDQLKQYRQQLNLRFGGIRKPRFGNSDLLVMARQQGWTIGQASGGGAGGNRNLNYSIPEVRDYYAKAQGHYLTDGVEFFWNDEGETMYHTFYWWNHAQQSTLKNSPHPNKRFFTINRAFTPGAAAQGAITWTGDINPTWSDLVSTVGMLVNWALAGSPIVTCDIGGFTGQTNALLLTRWYQAGVFLPVMRVHSTKSATPHFPFLWGDEGALAMRAALELRYRLVPHHYSLAHAMSKTGIPTMRPMLMEFPEDQAVADLTTQWMVGDSMLVAPIISEDNSSAVYLPEGDWYDLQTGAMSTGPLNVSHQGEALTRIPCYIKAGSIVPMAPLVQYTDALPGNGTLSVHLYTGGNGEFVLVEDDGETTDSAVRETTFTWDEVDQVLSWEAVGEYGAGNSSGALYDTVQVFAYFGATGGTKVFKSAVSLGNSGTITF